MSHSIPSSCRGSVHPECLMRMRRTSSANLFSTMIATLWLWNSVDYWSRCMELTSRIRSWLPLLRTAFTSFARVRNTWFLPILKKYLWSCTQTRASLQLYTPWHYICLKTITWFLNVSLGEVTASLTDNSSELFRIGSSIKQVTHGCWQSVNVSLCLCARCRALRPRYSAPPTLRMWFEHDFRIRINAPPFCQPTVRISRPFLRPSTEQVSC